jgi:hypothetical protein
MSRPMFSRPFGASGRLLVAVTALVACAAFGLSHAGVGGAAPACPTFQVLHNDRIGKLSLPQGTYNVTTKAISCVASSQLFTQFLNDWDGRLPGGWKTIPLAVGRGTFTNGGQSFTVSRAGSAPTGNLVCSQRIVITENDRIGALVINKGRYLIDRLGPLSPSCSQATSLLQSFLMDFDGILPSGWTVLAGDGSFVRGSVSYGFRLEPAPNSGGGGNRYPTQTTRCPATFQVVHNDRIGALPFPAGPYWVSIYKGSNITCTQSTQLFAAFLNRPDGSLPSPWVINVATGSFRKGNGNPYGFVAKPAFNVAAKKG